ncbi:MAG TPA: SDR family oxidoreductase [Thermomicrobiales bacterium]
MKVLVTGGAGFIGSHLAEGLVRRGHEVRVFDNLSTGSLDNLAPVRDAVEVVIGDLRDGEAVRRAVAGAEVVFHQAADPSVPRSISHPRDCYEINVLGTLTLLVAARDAGCRRVVFASTCAVYGNDPRQPKSEELPPAPESPYAASKLAGEELCQVFTRVYGLETVALRYFNVYGPRQSPDGPYASVIPRFIADLKAGARPRVFGDGEQTRDFIFVGDVVEANLRAATADEAVGEVVNVGSGRSTSLNTLLTVLAPLIGNTVEPIYEAERPGDVRHSLAETSKARRLLGFEAQTSLAEGLAQTVRG